MNVCGACGLDFAGVSAFDAHRVGKHAYTSTEGLRMDPPREDGRRCLYPHELEEKGFVQNSWGRWTLADQLERARSVYPSARRAA